MVTRRFLWRASTLPMALPNSKCFISRFTRPHNPSDKFGCRLMEGSPPEKSAMAVIASGVRASGSSPDRSCRRTKISISSRPSSYRRKLLASPSLNSRGCGDCSRARQVGQASSRAAGALLPRPARGCRDRRTVHRRAARRHRTLKAGFRKGVRRAICAHVSIPARRRLHRPHKSRRPLLSGPRRAGLDLSVGQQ
jgi:hypothetical protein